MENKKNNEHFAPLRLCGLILFFVSFSIRLSGQQITPLNRIYNLELERDLNKKGSNIHTGLKPYIQSFTNSDSIYQSSQDTFIRKFRKNYIARKLRQENFIILNKEALDLRIDPILNVYGGKNLITDSSYYTNTRGLMVKGKIGNNFSFNTWFAENQSVLPEYTAAFVKRNEVVPGQGRAKTFKTNGYDYAMAQGNISYTFLTHYNVQFGHGKHFIGDGYRSLLMSDNAFNYPYLQLTANFKNIQYTTIYSSMQIIKGGRLNISAGLTEPLFKKKSATFHYLSWNIKDIVYLGLFEGIIWRSRDTTYDKFNPNILNPVIYAPAAQYGLNGWNNVLTGITAKIKVLKNLQLYGQYVLDDNREKKPTYQAGIKAYDLFKIRNLHIMAEYNQVASSTYLSSKNDQTYTHYNQPLAHPLGNNFREVSGLINYRFRNVGIQVKYSKAIFQSELSLLSIPPVNYTSLPSIYYGNHGSVEYLNGRLFYILNNRNHLQLFAEGTIRKSSGWNFTKNDVFAFIGIKTLINDFYLDF